MTRFTLYGSPHSLPTYKVALMLRLSNEPFSFRYVRFQKGTHKTAEFLGAVALAPGAGADRQRTRLSPVGGDRRASGRNARPLRGSRCRDAPGRAGVAVLGHGRAVSTDLQQLWRGARWAGLPPHAPSSRRLPPTIADGPTQPCRMLDSHLAHGSYLCAAQPTIADLFCYGDAAFAELCGFEPQALGQPGRLDREGDGAAGLQGAFRLVGHGERRTRLELAAFLLRILPGWDPRQARSNGRRHACGATS